MTMTSACCGCHTRAHALRALIDRVRRSGRLRCCVVGALRIPSVLLAWSDVRGCWLGCSEALYAHRTLSPTIPSLLEQSFIGSCLHDPDCTFSFGKTHTLGPPEGLAGATGRPIPKPKMPSRAQPVAQNTVLGPVCGPRRRSGPSLGPRAALWAGSQ